MFSIFGKGYLSPPISICANTHECVCECVSAYVRCADDKNVMKEV